MAATPRRGPRGPRRAWRRTLPRAARRPWWPRRGPSSTSPSQSAALHSPQLVRSQECTSEGVVFRSYFFTRLAQCFASCIRHHAICDKSRLGFIVQLRSLEDHSVLPGVTLGDIGGKFDSGAYNSMDNGVLRFDHVRIPRDQMLMRLMKFLELVR